MKRYIAVWGSIFFFVVCCSLYLMLETLSMQPARPDVLNEYDLDSIEGKIKRIEGDLQKNQDTIRKIKDTVRQIAKGDENGIKSLKQIFDDAGNNGVVRMDQKSNGNIMEVLGAGKAVSIAEGMCSLQDAPEAKTDVKMLQVFDILPFDNPDGGVWKQGWDITYERRERTSQKLRVFVIPHSHCDPVHTTILQRFSKQQSLQDSQSPSTTLINQKFTIESKVTGWIKTFDRYYTDQTQFIFKNMVPKLEQDPRRRFIYAEMSFFSVWWDEIDNSMKDRVRNLIKSGQLEIVTGGWVMTDEANAHYFAMIDQLIEGHQWLEGTVGVKPVSGWAIDPFGHSPTMAYILKKVGLRSMLIQRVHYAVKKHLAQNKQLEFRWRQQWDQAGSTDMFCHMMPFYSYDVPHTCGPDPKICCQFDFKRLPGGKLSCPWKVPPVPITDQNIAERAEMILDQYRKKAQLYKNDVLLVPLGDDFRYDKPEEWDNQFSNYQKLFDHINGRPELNAELQFGTLKEYFGALAERSKLDPTQDLLPQGYPILSGDFFTYSDREDHYWSGYFTSRPFYKSLDRITEYHLRAGEIAFSLAMAYVRKFGVKSFPSEPMMKNLVSARRSLGLYQHHDGITGTAKDFVVVDYGKKLLKAIMDLKRMIVECAYLLMMSDKKSYSYQEVTPVFNIDEYRISHDSMPEKTVLRLSNQPQDVLFYNSLAQQREQLVTVYTNSPHVEVKNPEGAVITSQTDAFWFTEHEISTNKFKVSFVVTVPALGISRYTIQTVPEASNPHNKLSYITIYNHGSPGISQQGPFSVDTKSPEPFSIENSQLSGDFSGETGLLTSVVSKENNVKHQIQLSFVMYGVKMAKEKSGAYLFLPDGEAQPVAISKPLIRVLRGPLMSEVKVMLPYVEHVVRLQNSPGTDGSSVEIHNIVDIKSQQNKELAMRVDTDVSNQDKEFFTDLNGFQMHRRRTLDKLPLQANYYPMPTMVYLEDDEKRVTIVTAQALGVASLKQGQFEVMQDRRLNQDDNRGLGQGVLDNKRTPNKFRLFIERRTGKKPPGITTPLPSLKGQITLHNFLHPVFVIPKNAESLSAPLQNIFSPLGQDLPCEIHLLNLRTLQNADDNPTLKFIPKDMSAMLLHHLGFDCTFPSPSLSCKTNNGKVDLSSMFSELSVGTAISASLSLLREDGELDSLHIQIPPMEIFTLKVSFI